MNIFNKTLTDYMHHRTAEIVKAHNMSQDGAAMMAYSEYTGVSYEELTAKTRNALPDSAFVFQKERRFPIHNFSHAVSAISYSKGTKDHAAVMKAVCKKYPEMPACKTQFDEDACWIECFMTGTHTSGTGVTKTYTEDDIHEIASLYNSQTEHKAPLVFGHPATDDPAHGWVQSLKVIGNKVYAFCDQVSKFARDSTKSGAYKFVSIALYPNKLLRHVGLLGATPPAVKGLAPVAFSADEEFEEFQTQFSGWATDEFRMPTVGKLLSSVRDFFIEKFGLDTAEKILDKGSINSLLKSATETYVPDEQPQSTYNEQEDEMELKELEEKFKGLETQFKEQATAIGTLTQGITALTQTVTQFSEGTTAAIAALKVDKEAGSKADFAVFCESMVAAGKVLAAEKPALIEEYTDLITLEKGVTFAESQVRPSAKLRARIEARPVVNQKRGIWAKPDKATPGADGQLPSTYSEVAGSVDPASLELDAQIKALAAEKKITYAEAASQFMAS